MSYIRSIAYTDSDVQVFANNVQIALVRSITENVKTRMYPLKAFGELQPLSVIPGGRSYEIVLTREESADGVDFTLLDEFDLHLKKSAGVIVYSNCRLESTEIVRKAGEPLIEKLRFTAEGRKEVPIWTTTT